MRKRWRTWALTALLVIPSASSLAAAPSPVPSRQAEIREQAKGLLAARLKADVGLTDAQVGEVLPGSRRSRSHAASPSARAGGCSQR